MTEDEIRAVVALEQELNTAYKEVVRLHSRMTEIKTRIDELHQQEEEEYAALPVPPRNRGFMALLFG